MTPDHYAHGSQIDPDAERELRDWAFAHEDEPPAPEAAEFAPVPWFGDGDLLRPLHSIDDYAAWKDNAPERPAP